MVPLGTDHCSSEECRCTNFGACVNIVSMCAVLPVVDTSNISSCQKILFSIPVAVNNSIKEGLPVFLL
jgi:hypothetical protein